MPSEKTDKSGYQSRFGGGWIAPGQFIAESMCDRIARKDKAELPLKFWTLERWKRPFLLQLRHANSLLKLYSAEAIIRALRTPEGKRVYSLGAQWLDPLIRVEQERVDRQAEAREKAPAAEPAPPAATTEPPRQPYKPRPSPLDKLRQLDGKEG